MGVVRNARRVRNIGRVNYSLHRSEGRDADPKGYYRALGIDYDADQKAIKRAYRRRIKHFHPDRNRSQHARTAFEFVTQAYRVLTNPQLREYYDRTGHVEGFAEVAAKRRNALWASLGLTLLISIAGAVWWLQDSEWGGLGSAEVATPTTSDAPTSLAEGTLSTDQPNEDPALAATFPVPSQRPTNVARALEEWNGVDQLNRFDSIVVKSNAASEKIRIMPPQSNINLISAKDPQPLSDQEHSLSHCAYKLSVRGPHGSMAIDRPDNADVVRFENVTTQDVLLKLRGSDGGTLANVYLHHSREAVLADIPFGVNHVSIATGQEFVPDCRLFLQDMQIFDLPWPKQAISAAPTNFRITPVLLEQAWKGDLQAFVAD